MSLIRRRTMALVLCLACISSAATARQASKQELEQLKRDIHQLQQQLQKDKGQRSSVAKSLRKTETGIGQLQNQIRKIQSELVEQNKELNRLQARRSELLSAKQKQQTLIAEHIVAAYQIGRQNKLKILLNQEQPEKLSRALTYYDYLNRERSTYINNYTGTLHELDAIEPEIARRTQGLQEARDKLVVQRQELTVQQSEREKTLHRLEDSIRGKDEQLRKMRKDHQRLEQLLNAVKETIATLQIPSDYRPFKELQGKMAWPTEGRFSKRFGQSREAGLRWQGVMIEGREGNPVKAIHHGRVVFADWFRGKGLLIIIDHGDGFMSLYAHNQSLLRETGDWVKAGETVATVGNSGGLQSAALYFEIRQQGRPSDPGKWCRSG